MSDSMNRAITCVNEWYEALPRYRASGGGPARGTIAAALWVLERLREEYTLDLQAHLTDGGAQIKGISPANIASILRRFSETRDFLTEGGRTNRGVPRAISDLLAALKTADLADLPKDERNPILERLQTILVDKIQEYHARRRIEPSYDPSKSTRHFIVDVLRKAEETGKRGYAAQHLVGAKLQLRFPHLAVRNEAGSAADDPSGQPGDFLIGDTVFHVTVAPMNIHFEKCKRNLKLGLRVFLLVTEDRLLGARQNAEMLDGDRIAVEAVETFVSQNIEELSEFAHDRVRLGLRRLIEIYNERIDAVETDKSLMIELPPNLLA